MLKYTKYPWRHIEFPSRFVIHTRNLYPKGYISIPTGNI